MYSVLKVKGSAIRVHISTKILAMVLLYGNSGVLLFNTYVLHGVLLTVCNFYFIYLLTCISVLRI